MGPKLSLTTSMVSDNGYNFVLSENANIDKVVMLSTQVEFDQRHSDPLMLLDDLMPLLRLYEYKLPVRLLTLRQDHYAEVIDDLATFASTPKTLMSQAEIARNVELRLQMPAMQTPGWIPLVFLALCDHPHADLWFSQCKRAMQLLRWFRRWNDSLSAKRGGPRLSWRTTSSDTYTHRIVSTLNAAVGE